MTKTPELLARCLAGFLLVTTGCGAAESPPNIEYTAVPVSTKLEVPGAKSAGHKRCPANKTFRSLYCPATKVGRRAPIYSCRSLRRQGSFLTG